MIDRLDRRSVFIIDNCLENGLKIRYTYIKQQTDFRKYCLFVELWFFCKYCLGIINKTLVF